MSKRMSVGSSSCSYSSSCGDSSFGENELSSTPSPNPESVRATLDMYVGAAKIGREAFARGDIRAAVHQFDQALALELQTELDCIYDPSIGMVSGLVRKEVSERMRTSPRHLPTMTNCNKVMQSLLQIYTASETTARHKPTDPKLYLRMGAALCCANEWEKAKKIYTDGLNFCKDRKELKLALKRLCRMDQITTGIDIPTEPYQPSTLVKKRVKSRTLQSALRLVRTKSISTEYLSVDLSAGDTASLDNRQRKSSRVTDDKKPRQKARRVSSFGRIRQKKKAPEVGHEERESWSTVFQSGFCGEQVYMKPSAITQMRRLSVDFLDQSSDEEQATALSASQPNKQSFTAVAFKSMKIDSDDSELEDD